MSSGTREFARSRRGKAHASIEGYVGSRIRLRRKMLGMTQQCLAGALGVSFQQVHKYETGTSCICAGRLHLIARALDTPVAFFFPRSEHSGSAEDDELAGAKADLLASPEAVEITLAAMQVADPKVRRRLIELVRSIALTSRELPPED